MSERIKAEIHIDDLMIESDAREEYDAYLESLERSGDEPIDDRPIVINLPILDDNGHPTGEYETFTPDELRADLTEKWLDALSVPSVVLPVQYRHKRKQTPLSSVARQLNVQDEQSRKVHERAEKQRRIAIYSAQVANSSPSDSEELPSERITFLPRV